MNRGANSDSIPMDLIPEILSRLPAKSIARFRCVSMLWESIICRQDFTELFRTVSSSNPRLLIMVKQDTSKPRRLLMVRQDRWSCLNTASDSLCCIFSSPQLQNHYGKSSSLVVAAADVHTKLSKDTSITCAQRNPYHFSYACGLFYFPSMWISKKDIYDDDVGVICKPSTGQYAILPPDRLRTRYGNCGGLLGFDPIGKQYKVLVFKDYVNGERVYHILTLGTTENVRWRELKCPSSDGPDFSGICINGVLYYIIASTKLGCFDVRSEKFKLLNVYPHVPIDKFQDLINYKGKLCGSKLEYGHDGGFPLKLLMWVLEDFENREWSTYAFTLSAENKVAKVKNDLSIVGVTASGEIVLAKRTLNKPPFYVFYFNPETNTLLSVEIQGIREEEKWSPSHRVYCFVDHVEDLNFDVLKTSYAATSSRSRRSSSEDRCSPGTRSSPV